MSMKILNLYSGIGGNRKLWQNVEVTAVEFNEEIAAIYREYFPDDKMIIGDAHEYLLKHYKEFDFIWSSPPCQSHSRTNYFLNAKGVERYPDLKLYEEVFFLKQFAKCKYVVENVISYYQPLVAPQELARHYFWANFKIQPLEFNEIHVGRMCGKKSEIGVTQGELRKQRWDILGFDLSSYKINKVLQEQVLNNCVNPDLGLYILEQAQGIIRQDKIKQIGLFNEDAA